MSVQQALKILELPAAQLATWLSQKVEQNPVLHIEEKRGKASPSEILAQELDFEKSRFEVLETLDPSFGEAVFGQEEPWEPEAIHEPSLFEYLMAQAQELFSLPSDLKKAENIVGNLNERGFLENHPADASILKAIQTLDPPGIAARNIQESLLIQLQRKGKQDSLSHFLIEHYFSDLLQNKLPKIATETGLSIQAMQDAFTKDIAKCSFSPASPFLKISPQPLVVDIFVRKIGESWHVEINEHLFPSLKISHLPLNNFTPSEQRFLRGQISEGKQILEALTRRRQTLEKIVLLLIKKQEPFLNGHSLKRTPLSMRAAATELGFHTSTVTRAVSGKIISCPQGTFPLRAFFSSALKSSSGNQISSQTARELLRKLVEQEDKRKPYSDDALSASLSQLGIACARRTVAKYRSLLGIPPAPLRKKWL